MSFQEKNKINKRHCCVSGCKTTRGHISSLHRFPLRDKNLYERWLKILNIQKPLKEMYVCSKHFGENDFFGGWLAVEPNKRRLKRGVIPSLELPLLKTDEESIIENIKTSLNQSVNFEEFLNLKPVEKNISISDSPTSSDEFTKIKEDGDIPDEEICNKSKEERLEEVATDADNLLILKCVSEIQEAPESQAKKKHEAQIYMNKMRELKKIHMKKMLGASIAPVRKFSPETPKLQVKRIQELTQSQGKKFQVVGLGEMQESSPEVKKIRVMSQAELEEMQESPQHFQKIRVLSQSQLNEMQEHTQSQIIDHEESRADALDKNCEQAQTQMGTDPMLAQSRMRKGQTHRQVKKTPESFQREIKNMRERRKSLIQDSQILHSDTKNLSLQDLLEPNEVHAERSKRFGKFMNDTIGYFDRVIKDFDTTFSDKVEEPSFREKNMVTSPNKSQNINFQRSRKVQNHSKMMASMSPSLSNSMDHLEKMISQISAEMSTNENTTLSTFVNQCTQTENNQNRGKPVQTDNYSGHWNNKELEKTKNENYALKEKVAALTKKISILEKEILGDGKTQLLYVIKSS